MSWSLARFSSATVCTKASQNWALNSLSCSLLRYSMLELRADSTPVSGLVNHSGASGKSGRSSPSGCWTPELVG